MEIALNGHSGCVITVISSKNGLFVRKKSPDKEYNNRLIAQYLKQTELTFPSVRVTPTLSQGYDDSGLFYFDMPYINGTTLAKYIYSISLDKIPSLVSKLIERTLGNVQYDRSAREIMCTKTDSVIKTILKMDEFKQGDNLKMICDSEEVLLSYPWDHMTRSPCHGDYTLENLLITKDEEIYAIDLLDSFYDSWEMDLAKLLQDVELKWSYRFSKKDDNLTVRLIIIRSCIIEHVRRMRDGVILLDHIEHLLLLNTLRIVPYTHDRATMDFLIEKIKYLLTKLK